MFKIASIICFSLFFIGCSTISTMIYKDTWPLPPKPKNASVKFFPLEERQNDENGFFISNKDAENLVNNVDAIKAYDKKLMVLIKTMAEHYNAKLEENNE